MPGGRAPCAAGNPPRRFASQCEVRCRRTSPRCWIFRSPPPAARWRFGPRGTRSSWAAPRGLHPTPWSGFPPVGSPASSDPPKTRRRLHGAEYDAMYLQEKIHLLAWQFEGGGDLFGALAAPVHAQRVGAFAEVESGLGESGRRRHRRVILQIVELSCQRFQSVAERLKFAVPLRLPVAGTSVHLAQQTIGAIDREHAGRGAAEYQSAQDAQGKNQQVHRTLRSRSARLMIC